MFRSAQAGLKRAKRPFVLLGAALYAMAIPVLAIIAGTGVLPLATLLVHCALFGTMSMAYGFLSTKNARFDMGTVAVTHRGLELDNTLIAEKDELEQGVVMPTPQGTLVRFRRKGLQMPLFVKVKNEHEGVELLSSLGFDATQTAAEMRIATGLAAMPVASQMLVMMPPIFAVMIGAFLTAIFFPHAGGPVVFGMVALLITYVFSIAFAPTHVRIGTDGIVWRWLGRERFLPFSEIERAEKYEEIIGTKLQMGVRVTRRGGEIVRLPTGQTDIARSEAAALLERIDEARQARRAGHVATTDLLVRGARTISEWMEALRKVGAGVHTLRSNALPIDTLLDVVENPAAPPSQRAGAAVAAASDPSARARIRIAAETTASPKLRIALDRIAEESTPEAEIASALEDLG